MFVLVQKLKSMKSVFHNKQFVQFFKILFMYDIISLSYLKLCNGFILFQIVKKPQSHVSERRRRGEQTWTSICWLISQKSPTHRDVKGQYQQLGTQFRPSICVAGTQLSRPLLLPPQVHVTFWLSSCRRGILTNLKFLHPNYLLFLLARTQNYIIELRPWKFKQDYPSIK